MSGGRRKQRVGNEKSPEVTPLGKAFMWFVVATCVAVLLVLMWYARGILGQLRLAGENAGASTRLLTGLFIVMTFGGFVAAALWAALKKALGRDGEKRNG
jgi:hypothetical protein